MALFEYLDATGLSRFKSKIDTLLSNKVDKVTGKGLSTEDFTAPEKLKLAGIQNGAQVNAVTSVNGQTGAVVISAGGGDEREYTVTISADGKTITEVSGNDTTVTVFNNDGTITETYPSGDSYITTFGPGNTITKTKVVS